MEQLPESAAYSVVAEPEGNNIGTLDEDFAMESLTGDVFLLGTHSWRIRHVMQGRVYVEDAHGAAPSIPFWLGEAPGRSVELSAAVSRVRERLLKDEEFLKRECGLDDAGAKQVMTYVREGVRSLSVLPSADTVVAERFFDEAGGMQLILHAPFGSRVNRAWGLALRKRFCRTFNFELQAAATDNGIVISLSDRHAFPLELVFEFLKTGYGTGCSYAGALGCADVRSPLAVERYTSARYSSIPRWHEGSSPHSAHENPMTCWAQCSRIRWRARRT